MVTIDHAGLRKPDHAVEHLANEFTLHDVCVLYRGSPKLSLQFISRNGTTAVIHGFSEYRFSFVRVATVREPSSDAERRALDTGCDDVRGIGLAIPFTHNNLYHALWHAPPAYEALQQYVDHAISPPTFIPLLPLSAGIGKKTSLDPQTWHAWELTVRALSDASAADLATKTRRLLTGAPCTCFTTVYGNTAPFAPAARATAPRLHRWARATLARALFPLSVVPYLTSPCNKSLVYARRRTTRTLVNEAALLPIMARYGVQPVHLEDLPLREQLRLVSAASGLISAHSQALALLPFLHVTACTSGVVEILPPPIDSHQCDRHRSCDVKPPYFHLYESLALALGARHIGLVAALAPPCSRRRLRGKRLEAQLACNLTVEPRRFAAAVRAVAT